MPPASQKSRFAAALARREKCRKSGLFREIRINRSTMILYGQDQSGKRSPERFPAATATASRGWMFLDQLTSRREIAGRIDERHVRERLRKIAHQALGVRCRIPRRAARRRCAVPAAAQMSLRRRRDARAWRNCRPAKTCRAKTPLRPAAGRRCRAASDSEHEPVAHQLALDGGDGAAHARVVGGKKPTSGIISRLASSSLAP